MSRAKSVKQQRRDEMIGWMCVAFMAGFVAASTFYEVVLRVKGWK